MNKVLNEIACLKTPVDIVEFAANRVAYLEEVTPKRNITVFNSQFYNGYINMESAIYANMVFLPPFYVDDFNIYVDFLNTVKEEIGLNMIDKLDIRIIIGLIQIYLEKTFMSPDKTKADRKIVYEKNPSHVSIKDFYHNGSAKCIERTATVQNILAFLGIDTYLAFNDLSLVYDNDVNENDGQKEGHIINIIRYNDKLWAYDSKNMMSCKRNGKVVLAPALVELHGNDVTKINEFIMKSSDLASLYNAEPHKEYRKRKYKFYNFLTNA